MCHSLQYSFPFLVRPSSFSQSSSRSRPMVSRSARGRSSNNQRRHESLRDILSDRAHVFLGQSSDPARLRDVTAFNANAISSQRESLLGRRDPQISLFLFHLFELFRSRSVVVVFVMTASVTRGCSRVRSVFRKILRQLTMGIMREACALLLFWGEKDILKKRDEFLQLKFSNKRHEIQKRNRGYAHSICRPLASSLSI